MFAVFKFFYSILEKNWGNAKDRYNMSTDNCRVSSGAGRFGQSPVRFSLLFT